jgi:hypothetical protein
MPLQPVVTSPGIDRYLLPTVVVAVSLVPILVEVLRAPRREPAASTQEGPQ